MKTKRIKFGLRSKYRGLSQREIMLLWESLRDKGMALRQASLEARQAGSITHAEALTEEARRTDSLCDFIKGNSVAALEVEE